MQRKNALDASVKMKSMRDQSCRCMFRGNRNVEAGVKVWAQEDGLKGFPSTEVGSNILVLVLVEVEDPFESLVQDIDYLDFVCNQEYILINAAFRNLDNLP
ncbi:Hypothetical protein SMAX5B_013240 [Scophthalmus maximus]|uniref:Uncharacterized protein n=1 Tax=Scophthalmus maximus TaxID=52904 RepID=A0A2U9B6A0_SCOMX|nr:Hypothetical protein SMAX5B_013240 [Scophthalmus maximus]